MQIKISKFALATMPFMVAMALTACGGGSHHNNTPSSDNWAASTGEFETDKIPVIELPEIKEGCDAPAGALIISGADKLGEGPYSAWMWNDKGNILGASAAWPGEQITESLDSCSLKTNVYRHAKETATEAVEYVSLEGYNAIVSNGSAQTVDVVNYTSLTPCLKIGEKGGDGHYAASFVSATECGATVAGVTQDVPNEVYMLQGEKTLINGSSITINEIDGQEASGYTTLTLILKGANANADTVGTYWFGDNQTGAVEFKNGEKIVIGKDIKLGDGESKETTLNVQYTDGDKITTSQYKIKKSFSTKSDECRMSKQEQTLGATYTADKTTFRIWSPDSSDVKVNVDGTEYTLTKASLDCFTNVYEVSVEGDLVGKTYQFYIGGKKVRDPYGKMVAVENGVNSDANVVMDLSKSDPEGGWAATPALKNREDSIIYEVHVRDFTIDETSGVDAEKRGRYLGMVQTGTTYKDVKTGIDHLKELGVTHVQLQPIYDYATCSDVDSQNNDCYNWGYDPWNYNVPEDRYSSVFGTAQYDKKLQEVKEMINEFHKNGIRVIMDVVYNHTFDKTVFDAISGKYYQEKDTSGCGNSVNADQNMVWTMIRDSMDYWVSEFHIDGFRLDLVGVFGMKDYSDWGKYLNKQHPGANLVIYGEPWAADNDAADAQVTNTVRTGRMHMAEADAHVGAFNNRIRNCLKGSSDDAKALGFIFNKENDGWDDNGSYENDEKIKGNKNCVFMGVKAGVRHADATGTDQWSAQGFADPEQTLTYITAHDNLSLRDKIEFQGTGVTAESAEAKRLQVYANSIIMISQGMTFIHGGEEFGRTKAAAGTTGESPMWNSYKTTSGANDFKWDLKAGDYKDVNDSYASYIKMRNEHPAFRMTTAEQIFANVTLDEASTDEVVIVNIKGSAVNDSWKNIKVVMNSTTAEVNVDGVSELTKVADGVKVGEVTNNNKAAAQSVSIWAEIGEVEDKPEHEKMCFVGNDTSWAHKDMTYAEGKWTYKVTLTADSEFKITNCSWEDPATELGTDGTKICPKADGCTNNIKPATIGDVTVVVDDKTMELSYKK